MFKVIGLLILALGAGLYFPGTRAPILAKAAPLINPALRWTTRGEMDQIVKDLENWERTRRPFPAGRGEFTEWLEARYQARDTAIDAWGLDYQLQSGSVSFTVLSAGPDREYQTSDDLTVEGRRAPRRR